MNGRQFQQNMQMQNEPENLFLNDIYAKKLKLVEQIQKNRSEILPSFFPARKFSQWDVVLEEMKVVSYELRQQKNLKIAQNYNLARKIKKIIKHKNNHKKQLELIQQLISSELNEMVDHAFRSQWSKVENGMEEENTSEENHIKSEKIQNYIKRVISHNSNNQQQNNN